jgi:hypothetical protein
MAKAGVLVFMAGYAALLIRRPSAFRFPARSGNALQAFLDARFSNSRRLYLTQAHFHSGRRFSFTMKMLASTTLALCVLIGTAFAQLPGQSTPDSIKRDNGVVRDGFSLAANGDVMVTRDGRTQKVNQEFVLTDGTHLFPNGDIIFYTGGKSRLQAGQLMTLDGLVENTPITTRGVAPVNPPGVSANVKNEVGISSRDGITVSGADALITRNGNTDKITKQLQLSSGVIVNPDGTFIKNGAKLTLRENEVLGFDGVVRSAPIHDRGTLVPGTGAQ